MIAVLDRSKNVHKTRTEVVEYWRMSYLMAYISKSIIYVNRVFELGYGTAPHSCFLNNQVIYDAY